MNLSMTCTEMTHLREKAPVLFRGDLGKCFLKIKELGYDGAEVHIHDSSVIDRKKMKDQLERAGLKLTSIGTGTAYGMDHLSLTDDDPGVRRQAVQRLKDHVLTAGDYEHAVVIVGLIRGKVSSCSSLGAYEARLVESLRDCGEYAGERGAVLGLELINRYECDYGHAIEEGLMLLEKIGCPAVGLHLDTFHMNIEEGNIREAILKAGDRIQHVHIADSDRWYAGHGHYDFKETIEALRDAGYGHALAVESLFYPEAEVSARETIRTIRKLL